MRMLQGFDENIVDAKAVTGEEVIVTGIYATGFQDSAEYIIVFIEEDKAVDT